MKRSHTCNENGQQTSSIKSSGSFKAFVSLAKLMMLTSAPHPQLRPKTSAGPFQVGRKFSPEARIGTMSPFFVAFVVVAAAVLIKIQKLSFLCERTFLFWFLCFFSL